MAGKSPGSTLGYLQRTSTDQEQILPKYIIKFPAALITLTCPCIVREIDWPTLEEILTKAIKLYYSDPTNSSYQ